MNVQSAVEVCHHVFILAQMRHDAQLDLRIVGTEENFAFFWHKGASDFTPSSPLTGMFGGWDWTKINASGCDSLIERGMNMVLFGGESIWAMLRHTWRVTSSRRDVARFSPRWGAYLSKIPALLPKWNIAPSWSSSPSQRFAVHQTALLPLVWVR